MKLQIGGVVLGDDVVHFDGTPNGDPERQATIAVDRSALAAGFDLAATVQVLRDDGTIEFTGVLVSATLDEISDTVVMTLRTGAQRLKERKMGGLILAPGVHPAEASYSVLRLGGVKPHGMRLQGLTRPVARFEVITQVLGVEVDSEYPIGDVTLFGRSGYDPPEDLRSDQGFNAAGVHLVDALGNTNAWARVVIEGDSLFEAEAGGIAKIRAAVAWLSLAKRSSFSRTRGVEFLDYRRDLTQFSRPRVGDTVHVRSLSDPRRWLRNIDGFRAQSDIPVAASRTALIREVGSAEANLTNAILSWQRARDSDDPAVQISSLWQGLEQWVSGWKPNRPLFPPSLLKDIRKATTTVPFTDDQRQRLNDLLSDLNQPSLPSKLDLLIKERAVPVSEAEVKSLGRTRQVRNRVEHGNALTELEAEDIRIAIALLERLLIYSLS